jgi:hypothetical protein
MSDHPDECDCAECLRAESYMLGEVGLPAAMRALANFMVWVELEALFQSGHSLRIRDDHLVDAIESGKLRLEYP